MKTADYHISKLSQLTKYLDGGDGRAHTFHMMNTLDVTFATLADPTRRAVVERLATGPATVSELASAHDIALPTFMRHLAKLEACGLVRSVKKGRVRTCHIEAAPMMELQGWLEWQRRVWDGRMDKLSALADRMKRTSS